MTREELIAGLAGLNAPDQGMRYFGGGIDHSGPKFDSRTGAELRPRYRSAELTVHGDRARFLYALIEHGAALAESLTPPNATSTAVQGGAETDMLEPAEARRRAKMAEMRRLMHPEQDFADLRALAVCLRGRCDDPDADAAAAGLDALLDALEAGR